MTEFRMTEDYVKLSFLVGMFATAVDSFLGVDHFLPLVRENAWTLTWEKLAAWKAEAISRGVPENYLAEIQTEASASV